MRKECANQNCPKPDRQIEPERARWADYCLECAAERKRHWRQKKKQDNPLYTGYNPKNAQRRRESFHKRDPAGRTDSQRVAEWRKSNRERSRRQSNSAAAKYRLRLKLEIDSKLTEWDPNLKSQQKDGICRRCRLEELLRLDELLQHWNKLTNSAPRTVSELLTRVKASSGGEASNEEVAISNRLEL